MTRIALATLSVFELVFLFTDAHWAAIIARGAICAVFICVIPQFTFREWALSAMAAALGVGIVIFETDASGIWNALDRAAFFGAFIYLVTLLKEAAVRSPAVLELGHYLTNQPPGRRYYATAVGSHFMGVLLNFGAVSLLAPLIQRGAAPTPSSRTRTNAERSSENSAKYLLCYAGSPG